MGLLDLFRPNWLHSNPTIRLRALESISDSKTLIRIAREDADDDVRQAAIRRIDDGEVLSRIAMTGPIAGAHRAALAKIDDQSAIARIVTSAMDLRVREAAVEKVTDQTFLASLMAGASPSSIRVAAASALSDQEQLARLAEDDPDAKVRASAAAKLTDFTLQQKLASSDKESAVRLAAASGDEGLLAKLATDDEDPSNREAAIEMIASQESLFEIASKEMDVGTDLLGDQFVKRGSQDAALDRLTDERLLTAIAGKADDQRLVRAAVDKLSDKDRLRQVLTSDNWFAREAAAKKVGDPVVLLELITGEQDLDVLQAAVDRLADPMFDASLSSRDVAASLELAQSALRNTADAETAQAGSKRIITGSMPSAEKIATHFDRVVDKARSGPSS